MLVFGFCFTPLIIVGFILSIVLTKRMKVPVSLCQVHRRHWVWRNVIGIGGLIVLPLMGVGGIIVLNQAKAQPGLDDILGGYLCAGTFIGLLLWLISLMILEGRAIKAVEITDRGITLRGVSPAYLLALWEQRQAATVEPAEEGDQIPPPRETHQAGEFFDPDAARRRHPHREQEDEDDV